MIDSTGDHNLFYRHVMSDNMLLRIHVHELIGSSMYAFSLVTVSESAINWINHVRSSSVAVANLADRDRESAADAPHK